SIDGARLKAGPKISQVRSVALEADDVQYFAVDTNSFFAAVGSCKIRSACITRALAPDIRIVKRLLVAKNLKYIIQTESNAQLSLSAALESKMLDLDTMTAKSITDKKDLSSGRNLVIGVDFFDPAELQTASQCRDDMSILSISGSTIATADTGIRGRL